MQDDRVWLYGATLGMMANVCESLPWGIQEYSETDDPIWGNGEYEYAKVPKTVSIPDWNERKYSGKSTDDDDSYYFPRSLAQILYEETGCILPRNVECYYSELYCKG